MISNKKTSISFIYFRKEKETLVFLIGYVTIIHETIPLISLKGSEII